MVLATRLSLVLAACALIMAPARAVELGVVPGRIYGELLNRPSEMDDIRALGATMIRVAFEDHRDPAQLTLYKNVVAQFKTRGIETVGLLDSNSAPWDDFTTQKYRDAFTESVLWHIKNVPDVKAWEIWNEPEVFGFAPDPSRYAPLLVQVYKRVSAARASGEIPADVRIVSAAVVDTRWASVVFDAPEMRQYRAENNGAVPFDIANYHPYSGGYPWDAAPARPKGFREGRNFRDWFLYVCNLRGADGRLLFGNRPFWFTEWGFSTDNFGLNGARTALLQMVESMRGLPRIEKVLWYDYHDDVETYGLRFTDSAMSRATDPKPVYYAFFGEATGVGLRRTGANVVPTVIDAFIRRYQDEGGAAALGAPALYGTTAEMQRVGAGWLQRYSNAAGADSLITRSDADLPSTRLVSGPFLYAYNVAGGPGGALGYPTTERFTAGFLERQNLANGLIVSSPGVVSARLYGDADGNGAVTAADLDMALQHAMGFSVLNSLQTATMDVFPRDTPGVAVGDGAITVLDVLRLRRQG